MKRRFTPNISNTGRLIRGAMALAIFIGAAFAMNYSIWLGIPLVLMGGFVLFEAVRGWCAARACGIKTRY